MAAQSTPHRSPSKKVSPQKQAQLRAAVKMTVKQYRKTLELLART